MDGQALRYHTLQAVLQVLAAHPRGLRPKQVSASTGLDFPLSGHNGFVTYSALRFLHECGEVVREKHIYRLAAPNPDGSHLRSAVALATLKAALEHATEVPETAEDEQEVRGWSVFPGSLRGVLRPAPTLRMKPDVHWAAYVFSEGGNGNGVVWTLPTHAAVPDPSQCPILEDEFLSPPCPTSALGPGEFGVEGDGSPWSWLCLSMLSRAFEELGARWHGCDWSVHEILTEAPVDRELTWTAEAPADFSPRVHLGADGARVRFWTFTGLGQDKVVQHDDLYAPGSTVPVRTQTTVATGAGGFTF